MSATASRANDSDRTLVMTRVFDAPREAVFKAFVEPSQVARWMGQRTTKCEVTAFEARPGGAYRVILRQESGNVFIVRGVYREVVANEKLVYSWAWEDKVTGQPGHESQVTITLRGMGQKTEMSLKHEFFDSVG